MSARAQGPAGTPSRGPRTPVALVSAVATVAVIAMVAGGCGNGGPTMPSATGVTVAGSWTGTWQFVTAGATVTDAVTATLTQSGANASGTWTSASGASGQLSLTTSGTVTGTIGISQTTLAGQSCTASTTISGTATASSLMFTLASLQTSGVCQWGTSQQFSLTR